LNRSGAHELAPTRLSPLTMNATKKMPITVPRTFGRPGWMVVAPRNTAARAGNRQLGSVVESAEPDLAVSSTPAILARKPASTKATSTFRCTFSPTTATSTTRP
jgi:hypothetical protein